MSLLNGSTMSAGQPASLVDLLHHRAITQAKQPAFTFLTEQGAQKLRVTYAELDQRARAVAAQLQQMGVTGERVLLLYPPGLEYITGFLGCLYAGVVAVPAYPPDPTQLHRSLPRLQAIIEDTQARVALTTSAILPMVKGLQLQTRVTQKLERIPFLQTLLHRRSSRRPRSGAGLASLTWVATDTHHGDALSHHADAWRPPQLTPDSLAFLQYTSGSTSTPKGVMVSHGNLLHNARLIQHAFQFTPEVEGVIWLPMYHDMGLIGGVLQPICYGFHCTLMSPLDFLKSPLRWLQLISEVADRAVFSGGPNFAYELCVRRMATGKQLELDLSNWALAFCGAEPIRAETFTRFADCFAPYGFRSEAFYPCYGLAEATLFVTGGLPSAPPVIQHVQKHALQQHQVMLASSPSTHADPETQTLVGCGHVHLDQQLVIVNPDTLVQCDEGQIGEIWVAGPSVAQGYWQQPAATKATFHAYTKDTGAGPFLRTGDLGYLAGGELFVTGRRKDLIIIRGRNYYPQDIERTVEQSHAAFRPGCNAAFAVTVAGEERLVVVQEMRSSKKLDLNAVIATVRQAITEQHQLRPYAIVLIARGTIAKTSSGKIQRSACRAAFSQGELAVIKEWQDDLLPTSQAVTPAVIEKAVDRVLPQNTPVATLSQPQQPDAAAIAAWLVDHIAATVRLDATQIDVRQPLTTFGLDSAQTVSLIGELESWLDRTLAPTLAWEYPTIEALAHHLASATATPLPTPMRNSAKHTATDGIAIIGMGCRFPGANDPNAFWQLLHNGTDAIGEVPAQRWDVDHFYNPGSPLGAAPGKMNTRWGGFLGQVDGFDATFFGISPKEAVRMDPQQRLLLEVAWEALERAGQPTEKLVGSQSGIFIGISGSEYARLQLSNPLDIDLYAGTGNALSVAANRLSYLLDWHGPSLSIDTACSSSLVAVHYACQSLQQGECNLALAGGVNLILAPDVTIAFSQANMMARNGRCKTFDADADGYVRSEGCGVVVLKRLADAQRDGDPILAVLRGSAVNQDGRSNGLTAPNGLAQQAVVRQALQTAGVTPAQISYVETHGTGTPLGDPIEVHALAAVLCEGRPAAQPLVLGSVKTNIGHLEAAAGIAGLIKTVLTLQQGEIPPHLHLNALNPHLAVQDKPLVIATERHPLLQRDEPLLAGVSSFGFGGTNAHVIVQGAPQVEYRPRGAQEAPAASGLPDSAAPYLLPLSAHSPAALTARAQQFRNYMESVDAPLYDLCYTASLRRTHYDHRLAVVAHDKAALVSQLDAFLRGELRPGLVSGRRMANRPLGSAGKLVFVFPGQGAQWLGMGRSLYQQEPVFQQAIDRCAAAMQPYVTWSLVEQLFADEAQSRLDEVDVIQPTLFAMQVALAELWSAWGVKPDAVVGQSMGEVAAAHIAGALTLEDAACIICRRSQLAKTMSGQGGMAVIGLGRVEAQQFLASAAGDLDKRLAVAVSNSPTSCVLSGDVDALHAAVDALTQQKVACSLIKVDYASHCHHMDPLHEDLLATLATLQPQTAHTPIYSTVTGNPAPDMRFDAAYWWRNLREPVLFAEAIQQLLTDEYAFFLEISPHPIVANAIQQGLAHTKAEYDHRMVLPSLRRAQEERSVLLASLGALYTAGYPVDWGRRYPTGGHCMDLPTYPWQRERFWFASQAGQNGHAPQHFPTTTTHNGSAQHPLLGHHLQLATQADTHIWEQTLRIADQPTLAEHRLQGVATLPAAAWLEMALAATTTAFGPGLPTLQQISFTKALFLPKEGAQTIQLVFTNELPGAVTCQWFSTPTGATGEKSAWTLHATGLLRPNHVQPTVVQAPLDLQTVIREQCQQTMTGEAYYECLAAQGMQDGASLQAIKQIWYGDAVAAARLQLDDGNPALTGYQFHPALLHSCFQIMAAFTGIDALEQDAIYMPVALARLHIHARPTTELWLQAHLQQPATATDAITGNVTLLNGAGQVLIEMTGLCLQRLALPNATQQRAAQSIRSWFYEKQWVRKPQPTPSREQQTRATESAGDWLILTDRSGVGEALRTALCTAGADCILVTPGEGYRRLDQQTYELDPTDPAAFRRLLQETFTAHHQCRGIIHLWSLDGAAPVDAAVADLATVQRLGTASVLHLLQALAATPWSTPPRLWLVTRGTQAVDNTLAPIAVAQAALWGLARVITYEHPELRTTLVDLSTTVDSAEIAALCHVITSDEAEDEIALRSAVHYVARLAGATPTTDLASVALPKAATYLITGGCGGLGLAVAQWLVQQGARYLVLLGRSGASPAVQPTLAALEAAGAQVIVARGDVTQEADVARVLTTIRATLPPLRGVIHAAGIPDYGILADLDQARLAAVQAPKLLGAWQLHRLTQADELDFFVLFSSTMSVLGSPGLGNYAAANATLDALAHYRQQQGLPALSINWGPWAEVGLVAQLDGVGRLAFQGLETILPAQGLAAFGMLLRHATVQMAVMPVNWQQWRQYYPIAARAPLLADLIQATAGHAAEETDTFSRTAFFATPAPERHSWLTSHLGAHLATVLGYSSATATRLDLHQPLNTLGLDSLMAVQLKNRLEADLGVVIPIVTVLQGPTIAQLASQIMTQLTAEADDRPDNAQDNNGEAADWLDLDNLSDEEVDALLQNMMSAEEQLA